MAYARRHTHRRVEVLPAIRSDVIRGARCILIANHTLSVVRCQNVKLEEER
jgi:hypothetical protein